LVYSEAATDGSLTVFIIITNQVIYIYILPQLIMLDILQRTTFLLSFASSVRTVNCTVKTVYFLYVMEKVNIKLSAKTADYL